MKDSKYFKNPAKNKEFSDAMEAQIAKTAKGPLPLERMPGFSDSEDDGHESEDLLAGSGSDDDEDEVELRGSAKKSSTELDDDGSETELDDDSTQSEDLLRNEGEGLGLKVGDSVSRGSSFDTSTSADSGDMGRTSMPKGGVEDSEYAKGSEKKNSIVQIFNTASEFDYDNPHLKSSSTSWTGSGTVIKFEDKLMILTNAHVTDNYRRLQVRKSTGAKKYTARAINICSEADLALLEIVQNPEEFFGGIKPIELAQDLDVVAAGKKVSVKGFPMGGNELSETFGRVSRVEVSTYVHRMQELLQIQVDAAINAGNSGGPVFHKDKLAGVAFQGIAFADGLGYIIPNCIVKKFLRDSLKQDPRLRGFPELPFDTQDLDNEDQREVMGMSSEQSGILVLKVPTLFNAGAGVKSGDVLMEINGKRINNDATIDYPWLNHVDWTHEAAMSDIGANLPAKVLRDGQVLDINITVESQFSQSLMARPIRYNRGPTYLIESGFTFCPVSQNNIENLNEDQLFRGKKIDLAARVVETDEIIFINNVFSSDLTNSFDRFEGLALNRVNDIEVKNMVHLKEIFEDIDIGSVIKYELCNGAVVHIKKFTAEQDQELAEQNDLEGVTKTSSDLNSDMIAHYFVRHVDVRSRVRADGSVIIAADYEANKDTVLDLSVSVAAKTALGTTGHGTIAPTHRAPKSRPSSSSSSSSGARLSLVRTDRHAPKSRRASKRRVVESDSDGDDELEVAVVSRPSKAKAKVRAEASTSSRRARSDSEADDSDEMSDGMRDFIVDDEKEFTGLANMKGGREAMEAVNMLSLSHRQAFQSRLGELAEDDSSEDEDFVPDEPKAGNKRAGSGAGRNSKRRKNKY